MMASSWCPLRVTITLAVFGILFAGGCSRTHYRKQADQDVYRIVAEKSNDPRWALPGFSIDVDPRSRYYDPHNPDCEPMPEDDPYSHRYMQCVDGKAGYRRWLRNGVTYEVENPQWRERLGEYVGITPEGAIELGLDDAIRVAIIHSPDYREEVETLYLSALDVSAERFDFDLQIFGGNDTFFTHQGRLNPGGESNVLSTATDFQANKAFATGGELLVGFANSFVWQFAGADTSNANSIINFSIVQPLLRGGGRSLNLELLTRVERGLLANLRQFERFRQGFYTDIAVGSGTGGLNRLGGFFGGTGLTGFTGQGAGGFGGVGGGTFGFGAGGLGAGGGGAAAVAGAAGGGEGSVDGYIGLLQSLQQIRNSQASVAAKQRILAVFEANFDAGLINLNQVDTFRQSIETERAQLLQSQDGLQNRLDDFKVSTLGLPPDLELELDDSLIQRFQFIDPRATQFEDEISSFVSEFGGRVETATDSDLQSALASVEAFRNQIAPLFETTRNDLRRMDEASVERTRDMTEEELQRFNVDRQSLDIDLADLVQRYEATANDLDMLQSQVNDGIVMGVPDGIVTLTVRLKEIAQEMSLVQVRARLESIYLDEIDITPEQALAIAETHRLDWMNNRAALVDAWRLIEFNANALLSDLDVVFDGDMATIGNNPVKFRAPTGTLRAGLRFDGPFTRLLERNNYRQSLIDYQQARRGLIGFRDGIYQSMRGTLRSLRRFHVNLEIQRLAVVIAARRVDQTREQLNEPPPPAQPGEPPTQLGPTAAEDLLSALTALRDAQDNFMSVWLNYYAARMLLYRELGIMQLDSEGLWIDQPFRVEDWLPADPLDCQLPPEIPLEWINAAGGHLDGQEYIEHSPLPTPANSPGMSEFPAPANQPMRSSDSPLYHMPSEPQPGLPSANSVWDRRPAAGYGSQIRQISQPSAGPPHGPPATSYSSHEVPQSTLPWVVEQSMNPHRG